MYDIGIFMRKDIQKLNTVLRKHYKSHGRAHLPWRKTHDPYKILVSEVMLQQTQVERVIPFYNRFIKKFPTARALSKASLPDVLKLWQGLGYNRRGKMLRDAAGEIVEKFGGKFPRSIEEIKSLSGVGPYTAAAISAFAFNQPEVCIETNIRTVFLHHCFPHARKVSDTEILMLVKESLVSSKMEPRDFYAALMDYGTYLKKSGVKLNAKSKHYTKQSKFEGSARQLRGKILKTLLQKPMTLSQLVRECGRPLIEVREELIHLQKEKLIQSRGKKFLISI